jgi:AraC-like DNA-binding protein
MDPLSQIVGLLRPRALVWKVAKARGDWAIRYPANDGVVFCLIAAGSCWLDLPSAPSRRLDEGDFLLLTAPPEWVLRHGARATPVRFSPKSITPGVVRIIGDRRGGETTHLVGGRFELDGVNAGLLGTLLPARVVVSAPAIKRLVEMIGAEALARRPGQALVVERLLEVLFVEVMRQQGAPVAPLRPGLLAGLADPRIAPALRAIHGDVRRRWSVGTLASVAAMSRAAFADRFMRVVGLPPIGYLSQWRMALAKRALGEGDTPLAQVAQLCGYDSVSAFSTAFRREVGCPPGRFATQAAAARPAARRASGGS